MLSGSLPFEVKNPVVDEILSEKWNEDIQNYKDFTLMMKSLTHDIDELQNLRLNNEIIDKMKNMFGETVTIDAVKNYTQKTISKSRKEGTLVVGSTGVLSTGMGTKVEKNTFYGTGV